MKKSYFTTAMDDFYVQVRTVECFQDENRIQIYSPESQVGNFLKNKFKIIW